MLRTYLLYERVCNRAEGHINAFKCNGLFSQLVTSDKHNLTNSLSSSNGDKSKLYDKENEHIVYHAYLTMRLRNLRRWHKFRANWRIFHFWSSI